MGPNGPLVIHIGYQPAIVEEVYFPHAEVVGDIPASLSLLADRLEWEDSECRCAAPAARGDPRTHRRPGDRTSFHAAAHRPRCSRRYSAGRHRGARQGMYKIWFARNYRTKVANTLLLDNALATMGAGLPSAFMAAMLYPRRRVLAVCGDGGFMMNSQELETAVRLKLDLVILILVDNAYGMIRWKQAVDQFPISA